MSDHLSDLTQVSIILDDLRTVCGVGLGGDEDAADDRAIHDFFMNRVRPEKLGVLLSWESRFHRRQLVDQLCERFGWRIVRREIETLERGGE